MVATIWKILNKNSPGTSTTFGADDWDMPGRYFNDFDFTATAPTSIKTNTRYWDNRLRVWNPAKTFSYNIRSLALTANRDVTLPLLTSNDEFVMLLASQTMQNKIQNLTNNTLTDTGATTGGIPKHNGTKYVNIARGSAGQVPTVNVGGTDWTWADPSATNVADNAVSTAKIVDAAVTNAKLAGSITGDKILDGALTDAKLAPITDKTKLPADINYSGGSTLTNTGVLNTRHETAHGGMFSGVCVSTGTFSANSPGSGTQARWTTGSTSGNQGGFRTNVAMVERGHNFRLRGKFSLDSTVSTRGFIGVTSEMASFITAGFPLNAKSGIGLAWDTPFSATNHWFVHCDGTTNVLNNLSPAVPVDTSGHSFEIVANAALSRFDVTFDDVAQTPISTNIPAASTEMAVACYIETASAASRRFDIKYLLLETSIAS